MARTRRTISLDEKIEKAQAAVFRAKDKYDAAVEELNELLKKKREVQQQELLKAIEQSPRSYEEIMTFLSVLELAKEGFLFLKAGRDSRDISLTRRSN